MCAYIQGKLVGVAISKTLELALPVFIVLIAFGRSPYRFAGKGQLRMKNVIDSQGFGNLKACHFWPVTISFCKVYVKPRNANWVHGDYMAVWSLLPVVHILYGGRVDGCM